MELLSIDDFAARVGVSRQSVYKAIREGRLVGLKEGSKGYMLDYATQSKAWHENAKHPAKIPKNLNGGRPRLDGKPSKKHESKQPKDEAGKTDEPTESGQTMNQIQRERELVKLQLDNLKLKEAQGELISSAETRKQGRALATAVMNALYNIPERCSDEIAGMTDAHEIHKLLTSEIDNAVENLRKMYVD